MSREIKFRGMLRSGEWVYGGYVKIHSGAHCILSGEVKHLELDDGTTTNVLRFNAVKYKTVGEYTGLKDSQAIEEYYGDIVISTFDGGDEWELFVVEDGSAALLFRNVDTDEVWYFWMMPAHYVIGNIYESPHLVDSNSKL